MAQTNENYLRWRLGRYARDYAPNVTMLEATDKCEVELAPGERAVARIVLTRQGASPLLVTDRRLIQAGSVLLRYDDVRRCTWIDRDRDVTAELKHSHFDRLIIDLADGREVVLEGLGQAAFPLLNFFSNHVVGRQHDPAAASERVPARPLKVGPGATPQGSIMGLFGRIFGGDKGPPDPPALRQDIEKAMDGLAAVTTAHDSMWHLGEADWSLDQDVGNLVFTTPQGMHAVAPAQIIGTYNTQDGTWLWAWDHPSVEPALAKDANKLLAYGQQHGYAKLTTRKLQLTEDQAWELTALAFMVCGANGAYRGPAGTALVFMTFGKVHVSKAT